MQSAVIQLGVDILDPAWGTHFCVFYQTKGDLFDILIPYFKVGLENNEYCLWVTSEPLNEKDAENAMRAAIPNFDKYLQKNQIEIIPYTEWYVENNEFDSQRVLNGWVDKCKYALDNGFKGLRLTGNTFWLEDKDWKDFTDYEEEVNDVISSYNMIAVCTYSLEKCGSFEILDVVRNHQYALFRREGSWEIFKSSEQVKIEQKLKESEEKWRALSENSPAHVLLLDREHKIIFINRTVPDLSKEEVIGTSIYNYTPQEFHKVNRDFYNSVWETGEPSSMTTKYITKEGEIRYFDMWVGPVFQSEKVVALITHSMDITEQKKIQDELKAEEELNQMILDSLPFFMMLIRKNRTILSANKIALEVGAIIGEKCWNTFGHCNFIPKKDKEFIEQYGILPPNGTRCYFCQTEEAFEGQTPKHKEVYKDGKIFDTYWIPSEDDTFIHFAEDITIRKRVEQKLKESELKLGERVKELTCLYEISKLIENPVISLGDIINGTLNLIPPALQPPEITTARINYDGREYKFGNFEETEWKLSTRVKINEKPLLIDVYYLEDKLFLKEEHDLIREIGIRLKVTLEEKEAKNRLRESEEKYRMGFESSTDGIASANMEGTFIDCNNAFLELFGYSREDLFKLSFRELTPQRWHGMEDNMIISQLADGKDSGIYEKEFVRKDKTVFPVNVRFWIINDDQGDPVRMWTIVRDITKRKKTEEKIADLAKFPSENPQPVLRLNRNKVIYVNNSGRYLLDVDENDEIPDFIRKEVEKAYKSNKITDFDIELKDRIYLFTITPFVEQNYVNLYGMDITERKQVEQKLKEINQLKSEFLRRASHELKTPLISIKGYSDLILAMHKDQINPEVISKLNEINQGCERLQSIINNLLATSRLESPDIKPKVQKEDLTFLIKYCVHELQSLAQTRSQIINFDIQDGLYGYFEKEEIHDVISNLLTNAIKFTPPKGKIDLRTEIKNDVILISIKDDGIGFTEDEKSKIFKQFGKIERYGQGLDLGIDGTGLGLYISKRIVESHGGTIWMESEGKNQGSTFYFTIPAEKQ